MSVKQQFTEEEIYKDRDSQIAAIEKTFEDAQKAVGIWGFWGRFGVFGLGFWEGGFRVCLGAEFGGSFRADSGKFGVILGVVLGFFLGHLWGAFGVILGIIWGGIWCFHGVILGDLGMFLWG